MVFALLLVCFKLKHMPYSFQIKHDIHQRKTTLILIWTQLSLTNTNIILNITSISLIIVNIRLKNTQLCFKITDTTLSMYEHMIRHIKHT